MTAQDRTAATAWDNAYGQDGRAIVMEAQKRALESLDLARSQLLVAGTPTDASECADALAAADAHLLVAHDEIEAAFRGIDS